MWPVDARGIHAVFVDEGFLAHAPVVRQAVKGSDIAVIGGEPLAEAHLNMLAQQLPAHIKGLRVVVSNRLLRFGSVPWSDALAARETRATYLAARWRQVFGSPLESWVLALEPGAYEQPAVLLALPKATEAALKALAQRCGEQAVLVQPLIAAAWAAHRQQCPADALFATLEPGCLTVAVVRARQIVRVSTHRVDGDWVEAATIIRRRLVLQEPELAGLGPLRLLKLSAEKSPLKPSDDAIALLVPAATALPEVLLQVAARLTLRAGFALMPQVRRLALPEKCGLLAAAVVFVLAFAWRATLAPLDPAPLPQNDSAVSTALVSSLDSKARQKLQREVMAVNKSVRELNVPADAVLAAFAPAPKQDVALLGIDIASASDGKVHVTAAARSLDGMSGYLQSLEGRSALHDVALTHHEQATGTDWPYRFSVEALWRQP